MSELVIKRSDFDSAMGKLSEFANSLPEHPGFDKVDVEGRFCKFTDHHVTGKEMNLFIEAVQDRMGAVNDLIRRLFKEFSEVYAVFNVLDKEYVAGILQSVEEAHKAITAAQRASDDNTQTLQKLQVTVSKLLQLSQELSHFKAQCIGRLDDLEQQMPVLGGVVKDIRDLQKGQNSFKEQYEEVSRFSDFLKKRNVMDTISLLQTCVDEHNARIESLYTWHQEEISRLESSIRSENDMLRTEISSMVALREADQKSYHQRLIIAYALGGISLVLSLVGLSYVLLQ